MRLGLEVAVVASSGDAGAGSGCRCSRHCARPRVVTIVVGKRLGMVMTAVLVALKKAGSRGLSLLSGKAVAGGKPLSSSSDKAGVEKKIRDNELKNK